MEGILIDNRDPLRAAIFTSQVLVSGKITSAVDADLMFTGYLQ